jgi:hypothetical protein
MDAVTSTPVHIVAICFGIAARGRVQATTEAQGCSCNRTQHPSCQRRRWGKLASEVSNSQLPSRGRFCSGHSSWRNRSMAACDSGNSWRTGTSATIVRYTRILSAAIVFYTRFFNSQHLFFFAEDSVCIHQLYETGKMCRNICHFTLRMLHPSMRQT